jgi:hypothetical protein
MGKVFGMTSAYGHPVPVATALAQRFGEDIVPLELNDTQTTDGGRRARFIATMHALIAWLIAHPDVPVPWSCSIGIHTPDAATLEQLQEALGIRAYPPNAPLEQRQINVTTPIASGEFYTPITISVEHGDEPL